MDAIDHAACVLRMFEIEPAPLDRLLDSYLKDHPEMNSRQRRVVARAVYGVARWGRRIDACMRLAGIARPDHRLRAEAYLRWHPCDDFERMRAALRPDPRLDGLDVEAVGIERFPGGDAAFFSFPDFLYGALVDRFGAQGAREMAKVLNDPMGPTLRVNTLRAGREELIERLRAEGIGATPTPRSPFGLRLSIRSNFRGLRSFTDGLFEAQDESSQLAAILSDARPGERVLDACAGAGGKSLALAAMMGGRGEILAFDSKGRGRKEFARRAARAGARCARTVGAAALDSEGAAFDMVFVDAPCTGTGTLRRAPDLKWRIDAETAGGMAALQSGLLERCARLVRPGGRLLYATCSLLAEENERVVARFIARGGFETVDAGEVMLRRGVDPGGIVTDQGFLFTDPRLGDWDGFFAALLKRG
ncbi:MAG: RsmB/NOP family class I SAM-dependent RNA methyltransferase [Proteobacteria bacterium]|nr:RsmB/NOP family class I SAM-dependent RNA methyltransferase [Pseudomonadota bacterium]